VPAALCYLPLPALQASLALEAQAAYEKKHHLMLQKEHARLMQERQQLEQRDPNSVTFTQAAKLVGMGASVAELTETCGLTQAEAELMSKLHRGE
jgi:hypothetical protein